MKPKKDVAGFAGFTEILSVTIPWQEQLSIPKPLKHNSVLWGGIFAARNHLLGKLWSLLTVFHQSDLSPHALNYSTPHKSTATTYSYIPYIYRFIISPIFFQPGFFVFHFPSQDWKLRKTLGDHWDQFLVQTGRQHQVAAEATSWFSLMDTSSRKKRRILSHSPAPQRIWCSFPTPTVIDQLLMSSE